MSEPCDVGYLVAKIRPKQLPRMLLSQGSIADGVTVGGYLTRTDLLSAWLSSAIFGENVPAAANIPLSRLPRGETRSTSRGYRACGQSIGFCAK